MNKQSEPIALIDMDGTTCDFDGAIQEELLKLAAPNEIKYDEEPPWIKARRDVIKRRPGFWRNLKPLELGFKIVDQLRFLKFNLHVLTKGPFTSTNAWSEKVEWCQEHLPDAAVTVTMDKGLVYGKLLVDDWPHYAQRWLEWRPRGWVIMPLQPWNIDFKADRVFKFNGNNLNELIDLLSKIRASTIVETTLDDLALNLGMADQGLCPTCNQHLPEEENESK